MKNHSKPNSRIKLSSFIRNSNTGDRLTLIQFLYIEFFGAFVPGIVAVGSTSGIIAHSARFFGILDDSILKTTFSFGIQPYGFAFVLFVSYAVGAIIYRRPHSSPDNASICRYWLSADDSVRSRMAVSLGKNGAPPTLICWIVKVFHTVRNLKPISFFIDPFDFVFRPEKYVKSIKSRNSSPENANSRFGNGTCPPTRDKLEDDGPIDIDTEYPYAYLRRYLKKRQMEHLARFVYWCGLANENSRRVSHSKTFVNVIKQRIRASNRSELIRDMVRNEAHARLLSSLWYILRFSAKTIILVNVAFMTVCVMSKCLDRWNSGKFHKSDPTATRLDGEPNNTRQKQFEITSDKSSTNHVKRIILSIPVYEKLEWTDDNTQNDRATFWKKKFAYVSVNVLVLTLILHLKRCSESGFHYVRLRELVMTLENAHILQTSSKLRAKPFDDIIGKAKHFAKTNCKSGCAKCERHFSKSYPRISSPCQQ